jgi:serine protease Do
MKKWWIIVIALIVGGCQSSGSLYQYTRSNIENRLAFLSEKLKKSIVNIQVVKEYYLWGKKKKYTALGSGSIISEDGLIITNYHVAGDAKKIIVTLWNKKKVYADVVGEDPLTDLALIKLKPEKLKNIKLEAVKFGRYEDIKDGDYVLALGSPFGFSQTATFGVVANKKRVLSLDFEQNFDVGQAENPITLWIHHTAPIYGGNSGGPLFNMKGEQIGVNARGVIGGLSLAIAVNVVEDVVSRFKKYNGKPQWAYYGWRLSELTDELKTFYRLPEEFEGVFISDVVFGSPAYNAGIRSEDILLEIEGQRVNAVGKEEIPPILRLLAGKPLNMPVHIKVRKPLGEIVSTTVIPEDWEIWEIPLMAEAPGFQREKDFFASEVYGLSVQKIVKKFAVKEKLTEPWGVFCTGVETGSIAANAGLSGGDIIKYVNDTPITNIDVFKDIFASLEKTRPEKIKLIVLRGNSIEYIFLKDVEKIVGGKIK